MFADKYMERVIRTKSHLCVGLDPILDKFPSVLLERAEKMYGKTPEGAGYAIFEFNKLIIDTIADKVPVVKPQLAYYEKYDHFGVAAFWQTVEYAQKRGLLVIADAKRGDIGTTSQAYAEAFYKSTEDEWMSSVAVDAVTVNPYLGSDGLDPFVDLSSGNDKGTIILVKTSNPSSGELQDQIIENNGKCISELVCDYINSCSNPIGKYGFSDVGAVIGATYAKDLARFREILPNSLFLVPGIGYQGGDIKLLEAAFNEKGLGAIISCTRAINYAYQTVGVSEEEAKDSILKAVDSFNQSINSVLIGAGKYFIDEL
ncbi:orotidine-5'-phosphate decarboxylase [Pseudolactococcus reticulitermitis]|uniref:Orotidine 5'-phosphate decarboxylase n=1 Tax=Pseudolactococcus reticulitermitis TaxID=2025039 RepID=A0A224XAI7_9LACT|nr:orotidine-5'-phosphate decarboxylase [Lactococcus reticulitermitis]GAX46962.1 orotidine 5'-phosphate decarboxylase [Lactococcus reticulitermitis]